VGFFLLAHRYFKDSALAITANLILLALTCRIGAIQEVWLDVPTMAWAIWGLYFWDLWRTESRITHGVVFAICSLCALYTYQLSLFLIVAMFAVAGFLWRWPKADFSHSSAREPFAGYLRIALGFFVLLLPLVIFTLLLGQDQLKVAAGGQVIVIPSVLWVAEFLGWLTGRIAPRSWQAVLCIPIGCLVLIESGTRDYSKRFITEPVDMQRAFELVKERKNLLYSGTFDARFIFTVRSQDPSRSFRIFRGTVQLNEKDDLAVFLEKNKIDAVLVQRSQEGKAVAVHQRMENKLTDQLPGLGFSKIQTLLGTEIGDSVVPMLDVYIKQK